MTKPKAILPGRIFIAASLEEMQNISWDENCRLESLTWLEASSDSDLYPPRQWYVATSMVNATDPVTANRKFGWTAQPCNCEIDPPDPPDSRKTRFLCANDEPEVLWDTDYRSLPGMEWPAGTLDQGHYIVTFNGFYRIDSSSTSNADPVKFQLFQNGVALPSSLRVTSAVHASDYGNVTIKTIVDIGLYNSQTESLEVKYARHGTYNGAGPAMCNRTMVAEPIELHASDTLCD